jgi:amino acid adenylation domain-containing protein
MEGASVFRMFETIEGPPWPKQTLPQLVADQARRSPDRLAVQGGSRRLTYAELNNVSDRVAAALAAAGAGPGRMVAVTIDRSIELPVALLAVMKSGAAFVPIDPTYPPQRRAYMVEDSGSEITLTVARLADRATTEHVVIADDLPVETSPPPAAFAHDGLAYVMYTSGSTGRPKGVAVDHRSLVKGVLTMAPVVRPRPNDVWLSVASASFDPILVEIFLPLVYGNSLVIAADSDVLDGEALRAVLSLSGATVLQATPLTWRLLLQAGWAGPLRVALCGGETLSPQLGAALAARSAEVWNIYGPTETTVWSTAHRVRASDRHAVPVGQPLPDTTVHILDGEMRPVADGATGEVCIGGGGVALGYHGKPQLTAEKFAPDPFGPPGQRLYRTGDLGRWCADGALQLLGRADQQVKLRGHRVELGEIENWLQEHPSVTGAVAKIQHAGGEAEEALLVGYVSVRQGYRFDEPELRAHAAIRLPRHMVPGILVLVEAWPRTQSGKIDRGALPPASFRAGESRPVVEWDDDTTRVLAGIWQELLGAVPPGPHAHFFGLGGHSLQMMRMVGRIRAEFGVRIPAAQMMLSPTLTEQAALVRSAAAALARK